MSDADQREAALYARFRELAIASTTHAHTPVFTVGEAAAISDGLPGGHSKNLFLKDKKGGLWLVVVQAHLSVDLNALAKQLDAPRFSFGSAELLEATLGVTPGSVTPFALMNDGEHTVRVVLDQDILALSPLNFHPLRNDRTTAIAPDDLVRFVQACGHQPIILAIPEKTAG
ncbi:MAG: prolyl-tRNA synthetase associated domain-containing protein [Rhizomicrobium sp.]|nr:prolyl-tRNA synthetase associated domain-containing protein [Rhizomicrobium sp.]